LRPSPYIFYLFATEIYRDEHFSRRAEGKGCLEP
jgi:hypothetical protein